MSLILGEYSYGNPKLRGELSNVITGKFCSISDFATFDCGAQHNSDFISTFPFNQKLNIPEITSHPKTKGDIRIGSDVWIAEGAFVMSGITIGDGAVIAAGAVVTKNVKPYEVVGGVPAKHIKFRFSKEVIDKLLYLRWWDKGIEEIKQISPLLMSSNLEELFKLI